MITTRIRKHFFPFFEFLNLRRSTGDRWAEIVDRVDSLPHSSAEVIAFRLTMDRVRRAAGRRRSTCRDAFCAACTAEIVNSFDGSENELITFYYDNVRDVKATMADMKRRAATVRRRRQVAETLAA